MDVARRTLLRGSGAALAAPALLRRAVAAQAGAPLPIPPVVDADGTGGTLLEAIGGEHEFLAGSRTRVVGFNQPFLGPVLRMRRGHSARLQVRNRLREPITVHWHGLHVPGEVDGGPHSVIEPGASWTPTLEIDQPGGTYWYHSHMHRRTAEHVYWGLAGMLIVDDPAQSGLPSRYGVDDLPLVIQDRAFDARGDLAYSKRGPSLMTGFRGDRILVNGAIEPVATVPPGWVRLRLLNGSNARIYTLFFDDEREFHQIGTDGGLLPRPVSRRRLVLAPGERAEWLVDFSDRGPTRLLSLPDRNLPMGGMMGGMSGAEPPSVNGDGAFGVMQFRVDGQASATITALPASIAGAAPLPDFGEPVRRRRFELDIHGAMMGGMGRGMMGGGAGGGMTINGRSMDMGHINERVPLGQTELWEVRSAMMAHPFHVHATSFQVIRTSAGPVDFAEAGLKDTVLVDDRVELLVRFRHRADERRPFMYHCHILEHEDAGMMGQFTVG
ncbi:MAG: multicopper oxidase domain-containing protein [Burkholderiaceae bacterium]|nr:multicopper oxidase domain-containing protein [Burkholderiaceae bacterium]